MPIREKLKKIRLDNGWSQETMAEKLGYSKNGYAKIERGETELNFAKLEHIAQCLGVNLEELTTKDTNVFNLSEINHGSVGYNIVLSETQCAHELEKTQLLLQERDKEIIHLKEENTQLKKIIALLEKTN